MNRGSGRQRDSVAAAHFPCVLPLEPRALFDAPGAPHPLDPLPDPAVGPGPIMPAITVPLGAVPQLSSYPASPTKIYLNFTGAPAQQWGSFRPTATPAYDTDGDPTTFSDVEIGQVTEIFHRVAEKYSPFNVNVTTVDPGTYPYYETVRVVIGGDSAWANGRYGGYAYPGGFYGATSNTAWVFSKNLGSGLPKYVAEAAAHEAGHTFGLQHQSTYEGNVKVDDYNRGTPESAPIMGFSYYAARGLWWKGPALSGPSFPQDDLNVIGGPGSSFGYRPDDHADTRALAGWATATPADTDLAGFGVIEKSTDVDYFKFHTPGGLVQLTADVAALGPMLDLAVTLTDADGNVLASADTDSLGERVSALVSEGDYYIAIASHGGYGDIGQYRISGTTVPEPVGGPVLVVAGIAWLGGRRTPQRCGTVTAARPPAGGGPAGACAF